MTTKLSSKGQVVLPKQARARLQLRPGAIFVCRVEGDSIVLTPEHPITDKPKLIDDPESGLRITKSADHIQVTSDDVKAAMLDFP